MKSETKTLRKNTTPSMRHSLRIGRIMLLVLGLLTTVATTRADQFGDFTYTINSNTVSITDYTGSGDAVDIPSEIYGLPVTSIGNAAFNHHTSLVSITIPDSVISIGDWAFRGCTSLTSIMIPDSVISLGDWAFIDCTSLTAITVDTNNPAYSSIEGVLFDKSQNQLMAYPPNRVDSSYTIDGSVTSVRPYAFASCTNLTSITIPNSVTIIESSVFSRCTRLTSITIPNSVTSVRPNAFAYCTSLTSVTIPDSVISIGNSAFRACTSLTSIMIPDSVTSFGGGAFLRCSSLTAITVDINNPAYSSIEGVLFDKSQNQLMAYPPNRVDSSYTIDGSVTSVSPHAFAYCTNLTSITIPDSVISIGDGAFRDCTSLISLTIPDSVTSIGDGAFEDCTSLASVTIPNSVTNIERGVFSGCTSLTSITIPNSVTSIESIAFSGCTSLVSVTIPNSVTSIGYAAFRDCTSLTAITVNTHNPVYSSIGGVLFDKSQNELLVYPPSRIGSSYTIPDSVISIETGAFARCTILTSITIPDSVTSIERGVFSGCTSLISLTIPDSVTSIGDIAFDDCTNLVAITVDTNNPTYSSIGGVLFSKSQKQLMAYPPSRVGSSYTIPDSVISIGDAAFRDCTSLISLTIPDSVISIGNSAFRACTSLTSIMIPDSVTSIEGGAFIDCTSLTSITIPDSITSIGNLAFAGCSSLATMYFQGDAPSLKWGVFLSAENVTVYYLPGTTGWTNPWDGRPTVLLDGDSDGDQIADSWEITHFGVLSQSADGDNDMDGVTNLDEYIAGTDPMDKSSLFSIRCKTGASANPSELVLDWTAVSGRVYSVMWTPDLMRGFQPLEYGIMYPHNAFTGSANRATGYFKVMLSMPNAADTDADALPESWELQFFESEAVSSPQDDPDGDGQDNIHEYIAGTDPTNRTSLFKVSTSRVALGGTTHNVISWQSIPNRVYSVLWTPALDQPFGILEGDLSYPVSSYTDTVHTVKEMGFYSVDVKLD